MVDILTKVCYLFINHNIPGEETVKDIYALQSHYSDPNSEFHGFGYWINFNCAKHGCNCVTHVHSSWLDGNVPQYCKLHKDLGRSPFSNTYAAETSHHSESRRIDKYGDFGQRHIRDKTIASAKHKAKMKGRGLYGMRKNARDFLEKIG